GPVRQTQILDPTLGFALTSQGTVLVFNPTTGAVSTAFAPPAGREVNALQALVTAGSPFPILFTANDDGSVSLLTTQDGTTFTERATSADATLSNPSALEVVDLGDGLFDVYLTNAGESQPIVLTLALRAELTSLDSPLALVPVVTTSLTDLPEVASAVAASAAALAAGPASGPVEVFNSLLVSQTTVLDTDLIT